MFRPLASEHAADGSLSLIIRSAKGPAEKEDGHSGRDTKTFLKFNIANFSGDLDSSISESSPLLELVYGALLDNGIPYLANGNSELQTLPSTLIRD